MHSFDLHVPCHLIFGKDRIEELPGIISKFGKKVLLTYGGGSIKRSGLYDKVKELLKDCQIFELADIAPNPKIASVRAGVEICKKENIDVILAVGGGSVIDASKNISAGFGYDGDPWDLVLDASKIDKVLPIVTVLTLAATGSEFDNSAVISNPETNEKLPLFGPGKLDPSYSTCDPQYTYSVPKHQTAAGAADIMSHTFEQYLVKDGNELSDSMCEAVLRTVIKYAPKAIADGNDYEARANLMYVSSFGCNGLLAMGRSPSPWVCHGIEHEISAFTDITHGYGLAIITPHWMRYSLTSDTAARFAQYGVRVFGLQDHGDTMALANQAIDETAKFFKSIGLPSKLSDLGVGPEHFEEMASHVMKFWMPLDTAIRPLDKAAVLEILNNSL